MTGTKRVRQDDTTRHQSTEAKPAVTAPTPSEVVARHAATGLIPLPKATATILVWLNTLRDYLKGSVAGTVGDDVPKSLQPFLATARATTRLKTVLGGSRAEKATRYLSQLIHSLRGVPDAPFTVNAIDALATAYAVRRLQPDPPFEWHKVNSADTAASDLSAVAELSRKAGIPMHPHCGTTASAYLSARGAGSSPEHSNAWPIHLYDLAQHEPSPHQPTNPKWLAWAACMICSAFCLRPGVLPFLLLTMFVQWDNGYILIWQWMFKSRGGDVLDPELKSKVIRVAAARFPLLTRIFTTLQKGLDRSKPIFPATITRSMAEFVRDTFPSAPKGFTFRLYGIRIAADVTACAIDLSEEITNAMFWWRTIQKSLKAYYGALMVRRMYAFSEVRMRLRCIHITPGRFDARLVSGTVPDLSAKAMLVRKGKKDPEPPPLKPHQLDAAWGAEPPVAEQRMERVQKVELGDAAWAKLPAEAPETSDDETRSLDCEGCSKHLNRRTKGTLCDQQGCRAVKCVKCQKFDNPWRCELHADPKRRKAPAAARR